MTRPPHISSFGIFVHVKCKVGGSDVTKQPVGFKRFMVPRVPQSNLPYLKQVFPARLATHTVYCHVFHMLSVFSLTHVVEAPAVWPIHSWRGGFAYITAVLGAPHPLFFCCLRVSIQNMVEVCFKSSHCALFYELGPWSGVWNVNINASQVCLLLTVAGVFSIYECKLGLFSGSPWL